MFKFGRVRWTDRDREKYWGPFTYTRANRPRDYCPLSIMLRSGKGDDDDSWNNPCHLFISGFTHTLMMALPSIIKPWNKPIKSSIDGSTYYQSYEREYGFYLNENHFVLHFGRQTHDSSTTQDWSCFLPWSEWVHVRKSYYDTKGKLWWTEPKPDYSLKKSDIDFWQQIFRKSKQCPGVIFAFKDFDGEEIWCKTTIDEMEWHKGRGWFKWLKYFNKKKIERSLHLEFTGETGKKKGSWKGGTLGHGIKMRDSKELHESAFVRYCAENEMTFLGKIPEYVELTKDETERLAMQRGMNVGRVICNHTNNKYKDIIDTGKVNVEIVEKKQPEPVDIAIKVNLPKGG